MSEQPPKILVVDDVLENTDGQVLIAQRLYAEVEQDVDVVPVGEFTLKGFRRPVAAFDVVAVRPATPEPSRR